MICAICTYELARPPELPFWKAWLVYWCWEADGWVHAHCLDDLREEQTA